QQFFDLHRPDAVRILDFPHAASYLAIIATTAFGQGTPAAATWLARQCEGLTNEHGTPEDGLASIREVLSTLPAGMGHEMVAKALAYLEKRTDHLRYATFRAQGYPIGSGIVESANKTVVESRLKGAGMHWAPTHVNPMLALRTVACNDRWDEAWPQLVDHWRTQRRHRTTQRRHQQPTRHRLTIRISASPTAPPPVSPMSPVSPVSPVSPAPRRPAANHPWRRSFLHPSARSSLASSAKT
ncbi:MAG TPA: hypothetical protein VGW38_24680, partial [Chloroflexota bacterium]|nr:hypothetical protein [Chloroflexota bacterium]